MIDKIEVIKRSKIRRSKLYHIRDKAIKQANKRMKMMFVDNRTEDESVAETPAVETPATEEVKA